MLQRTALTLILVATCAICLSLVLQRRQMPTDSAHRSIVATTGSSAAPPM